MKTAQIVIEKELTKTKDELEHMPYDYQLAFLHGARYGVLAESIGSPIAEQIIEESDSWEDVS